MCFLHPLQLPHFNINASITQALNLHRHHSLSALDSAEFSFDSFQRAADDADVIAGLEDFVFHLDFAVLLAKHEFEVVDLGVRNDCRSFLSWVGQEFVDEGVLDLFLADTLFGVDLNKGRHLMFRVRYALVSPIDCRFKMFIQWHY